MSKAPAFQFYPKDYQSDEHVMLMDLDQRGAYVDLLCHSWLHGSIPSDVSALARICRTTPARMGRLWPGIAPCWKALEDGRLVNGRQEREREAQATRREVAAVKGRKGAEKRWPGHSHSHRSATARAMPGDGFPSPSATCSNERTTAAATPPASDWARLAADVYLATHPQAKVPGALFRALKPLVQKHGWPAVEVELRAYLRQTPIGRFSWDTQFAGCFGSWAKSQPIRGQPVTAGNDAVIDAFVRKVEEANG